MPATQGAARHAMNHPLPLFALALAAVLADPALAQRGGGGGRGRPEEIQNRVACRFAEVTAPAAAGDRAPDLATADLVRAAANAGQLTLLYLYDGGDAETLRMQFERTLFGNDTIGVHLRFFHCGRVDLAKAAALKEKYGKDAPLFLVYGKDGKQVAEVGMAGYKASGSALTKALEKAGNPLFKPSLSAAVKNYEELLRDLEQLLAKRKLVEERQGRATGDDASAKQKRAELDKELKDLADDQQKLEQKETDMLQKLRMPVQSADAVRLGGRGERGRGEGRGGRPGGGEGGRTGGGEGGGRTGG